MENPHIQIRDSPFHRLSRMVGIGFNEVIRIISIFATLILPFVKLCLDLFSTLLLGVAFIVQFASAIQSIDNFVLEVIQFILKTMIYILSLCFPRIFQPQEIFSMSGEIVAFLSNIFFQYLLYDITVSDWMILTPSVCGTYLIVHVIIGYYLAKHNHQREELSPIYILLFLYGVLSCLLFYTVYLAPETSFPAVIMLFKPSFNHLFHGLALITQLIYSPNFFLSSLFSYAHSPNLLMQREINIKIIELFRMICWTFVTMYQITFTKLHISELISTNKIPKSIFHFTYFKYQILYRIIDIENYCLIFHHLSLLIMKMRQYRLINSTFATMTPHELERLHDDPCSICLSDHNMDSVKLPCGHFLHRQCLFMTLNNHNNSQDFVNQPNRQAQPPARCPLCRTNIFPDSNPTPPSTNERSRTPIRVPHGRATLLVRSRSNSTSQQTSPGGSSSNQIRVRFISPQSDNANDNQSNNRVFFRVSPIPSTTSFSGSRPLSQTPNASTDDNNSNIRTVHLINTSNGSTRRRQNSITANSNISILSDTNFSEMALEQLFEAIDDLFELSNNVTVDSVSRVAQETTMREQILDEEAMRMAMNESIVLIESPFRNTTRPQQSTQQMSTNSVPVPSSSSSTSSMIPIPEPEETSQNVSQDISQGNSQESSQEIPEEIQDILPSQQESQPPLTPIPSYDAMDIQSNPVTAIKLEVPKDDTSVNLEEDNSNILEEESSNKQKRKRRRRESIPQPPIEPMTTRKRSLRSSILSEPSSTHNTLPSSSSSLATPRKSSNSYKQSELLESAVKPRTKRRRQI